MIKYKRIKAGYWNEYYIGRYYCDDLPYYRCPRHFNERRQMEGLRADGLVRKIKKKPDYCDDLKYSRQYRRSWKDCTKKKYQWE